MRINAIDGSIEFKGGEIGPAKGRTEFLASPLGKAAIEEKIDDLRYHYAFDGEAGLRCTAFYLANRLDRVFIMKALRATSGTEWSEERETVRKAAHDRLLTENLGEPPYQYAWGSVTSDHDPRGCASEIIVAYGR
jgi:hypothetical protein